MPHANGPLGTFRRLFLAHDPPHQAWMQPPGAAAKYRKKFHPISDAELAAHLAGRLTIAAPLTARMTWPTRPPWILTRRRRRARRGARRSARPGIDRASPSPGACST